MAGPRGPKRARLTSPPWLGPNLLPFCRLPHPLPLPPLTVLNKYYPPDFDPAKLPRGKRRETNEMKVRMMLPMSVRCKTCGTFMYKGTKFNTRKEDVMGENYLGIQIFRFYYRCKKCSAEFCMKTDPKNAGACRVVAWAAEVRPEHNRQRGWIASICMRCAAAHSTLTAG